MDGNGRWAQRRGLPRILGHKVGVESVRSVIKAARKIGVKYLTLYTFSSENWQRPAEEVGALMYMLKLLLRKEIRNLNHLGVRVKAIGELRLLPKDVQQVLDSTIKETSKNEEMVLTLALSYGGRKEIVRAVNRAISEGVRGVDEENFRRFLYDPDLPDLDLVIRTAGEYRLSNFMLWQAAYAELYFTDTLWPDFREEDFFKAIEDYSKRVRKFGKVL
ncbi:MAG: di-trans,poly-cis-decaprenylcistransferase [Thermotogae bacterium]|nr:di-trans,poly-cis-decaprenylcistransferase [Thermotogota bacterium]